MEQKSNIEKKAEDALNSLDGIRRASPAPYFFTRLAGRLQRNEKSAWDIFGSFISRPVVAFATICLILLINSVALFNKEADAVPVLTEQNEQTLNSAFDVASNTNNNTILTIWNPENEPTIEK